MNETSNVNGSATREKLFEAAGEIFAEKGLHGTTIRDITQRAGANIASVNYHFQDKFNLYTEALRRAHGSMLTATSMPLTADTPEGRLREMISAGLTAALDPARPKWQVQLLSRELAQPTPALDLTDDLMRPASQRLWNIMREIRPDLPDQQLMLAATGVAARFVFHVYHAHLARRMFPDVDVPDTQTLAEHVADSTLAALRGLPATPARTRPGSAAGKRASAKKGPGRTRQRRKERDAK